MSFAFQNRRATTGIQRRNHSRKEEDQGQTEQSPESRRRGRRMREIFIAPGNPPIVHLQGGRPTASVPFRGIVEQSQDPPIIRDPDIDPERSEPRCSSSRVRSSDSSGRIPIGRSSFPVPSSTLTSWCGPPCGPHSSPLRFSRSSSRSPRPPQMGSTIPDPPAYGQTGKTKELRVIPRDSTREHVEHRSDLDQ
jgi:hypothetical protein